MSSSSTSFFLASSRNFAHNVVDFASLRSKRVILNSSFFCSPTSHTFNSASQPSVTSDTFFFTQAASSRACLISSSTSSATLIISLEDISLALDNNGIESVSALATFTSAISTSFVASIIFPWNSALNFSSSFSLATRASLRLPSFACSRKMPTETLSFWKSSFLTPLALPTRSLKLPSKYDAGILKPNSFKAYFSTSLRSRMPSLFASYLAKNFPVASNFFLASAFFTAFSSATLASRKVESVVFAASLILPKSLVSVSLSSEGASAG
mmetsp:Transcript_44645/g.112203  ORF Transcript_44645/g.112203 Transcript_44645/m.112203 type:complete len:269 (-) Transcript_44645:838-1644(-)